MNQDPQTVACVTKGFFEKLAKINHGDKTLAQLAGRFDEDAEANIVHELCLHAALSEILQQFFESGDWPEELQDWQHSVDEPFGAALAEYLVLNHNMPGHNEGVEMLAALVNSLCGSLPGEIERFAAVRIKAYRHDDPWEHLRFYARKFGVSTAAVVSALHGNWLDVDPVGGGLGAAELDAQLKTIVIH